jgi:hypothetical protein
MAENVDEQALKQTREISPKNVIEWKNYLSSPENDLLIFNNVNSLRQDVESQGGWIKTKDLAKQEMKNIPEDIVPKLFERLKPYLETLPGAHSINHIYRDLINSININQDPWVKNLDDVEKLVGIMGGTFHDIGNSVVGRYEDAKRFAGHAETGAFLFGKIAGDLLPPNILKLSQFAIAAHTNYTKEIEIKKTVNGEEKNIVKKTYDDTLDEQGNKAGVWLTRWADRLDAQGVQIFVRSAVAKAEPTEDYDTEGFHKIHEDELQDFKHHFSPIMRTENFSQHGRNVLEHISMFRNTALLEKSTSVHSQHDTDYFTNELVRPSAEEQIEFISKVLKETPILPDDEIKKGFDVFYDMCRWIDNGSNIEQAIDLFKSKFPSLSKEEQSHWANGFLVLPKLYSQTLSRIDLKLNEANNDQNRSEIFKEAGKFALQKLEDLKKTPW